MFRDLALVGASAIAFRVMYHLARRLAARLGGPHDTPPFTSRLVSCAHALALTALGAAPGRGEWWLAAARAIPLGYLAHDTLLVCLEPSLWDPGMVGHHLIFAGLVVAAAGRYPAHTARAFLAELSVPLLNASWAMVKTGADRAHPILFGVVGAALVITFCYFRVGAFTALTLEAVEREEWHLAPPLFGLAALNWYWFALLVRKGARALRPAAPRPLWS